MKPEDAIEIAKKDCENDDGDKIIVELKWLAFWDALNNAQMAIALLRLTLADPNTKIMTAYRLRLEELLK